MVIERSAIEAAAERIGGRVRVTPVIEVEADAFGSHPAVTLKLELLQHSGSFKPRGAFNRILSAQVPAAGVIAASGGNHGAAVAFAARALGHRAEIFVPAPTPALKRDRLAQYGAKAVVGGANYAEAYVASQARAREIGALEVHAYDDPDVVAGQATLGRELEQQAPDLDAVFVAVGGGGLIAGVAAWYASRMRVIAVEPQTCPTLAQAFAQNQPVDVKTSGLASDSLGATRVGRMPFAIAQAHVDPHVVLVSDEEIRAAQKLLWDRLRLMAEPGGAAALAGFLSGRHPLPGKKIGVVVCGGECGSGKCGGVGDDTSLVSPGCRCHPSREPIPTEVPPLEGEGTLMPKLRCRCRRGRSMVSQYSMRSRPVSRNGSFAPTLPS